MKAAFIITGSEILTGYRQDTLVQPFASMLGIKGIDVIEVRMLSDSPDALVSAVDDLGCRSGMILVTGGLGQTPDDTTLTAIDVLSRRSSLQKDINNPVGQAKGIDMLIDNGTRVIFLPGVPKEAKAMLSELLDELSERKSEMVNIPVFGKGEVEIAAMLGPLAGNCGFLPHEMEITVVAPIHLEAQVRTILDKYALEDTDLSISVAGLLQTRGLHVACAESCTGGLVGHLITQVPGSSVFFLGSIVAYNNEVKHKVLGVKEEDLKIHGAVSREVAEAMLDGVLRLTGADVGIATTGIAGPSGGTKDKPVGTVWISVGTSTDHITRCLRFSFDRAGNKTVSAKASLFMLRSFIYDQGLYRHPSS
ncbi:MAG: nicotinamide-nucleotide amidohydrolase family protein [Deltaproteobacteria bacterium]|nr:nicotinamide-nucleotide amidohydrolase family protein [Deltaproteobacteria bacterium]